MSLFYCKCCLYPSTKPDLSFNEQGVCSACTAFESRKNIDWVKREQEFKQICNRLIEDKYQYHCVVPVSGGKDSHYQIIKAKEYGLNPLAVCASTDDLSDIGRYNLSNISSLGVDLLEFTCNTNLRRKINKYTLQEIGDTSWTEHVLIFTIPVHAAIKFKVPLILWGENPQNEYGGPEQAQYATKLDKRWLQEYGGMNGLRVADLITAKIAEERQLYMYSYPNFDLGTTSGVFLGQFFPWDGLENAVISAQKGFKSYSAPVEGIGYDYENLDNIQTGLHDRGKYIKFGFGRCTDLVNNHLRRGRITRGEAKEMILMHDNVFPRTYLGVALEETLGKIDMTVQDYLAVEEKFYNRDLFDRRKNGQLIPKFTETLKNA